MDRHLDHDTSDSQGPYLATQSSDQWSESSTISISETTPLIGNLDGEKQTPLPKLQVAALLLVLLPESLTSTLIYPFVVQVNYI